MKNEKNDNKKKNNNTNNIKEIKGGVCAAKGFFANGIYSGIKKKKTSKDLAIIYSESLCAPLRFILKIKFAELIL